MVVKERNLSRDNKLIACIILPTFNEVENIEHCIRSILIEQKNVSTHDLHILVVDDNSPDGTADVVVELQRVTDCIHLLRGEKQGLGEAYKRGMSHALAELKPDLIFEMDADGQHDSTLIPLFINLANHGFTVVIGSRFVLGGATPDFSLWRKTLSVVANFLVRYLGGIARIHDSTSGFRCIKADLLPRCNLGFLSTRGYSFQSSLLCELVRSGARVIEVPIIFPDRSLGESKLSFKDQAEFLLNIARIRFRNSEEFIKYCCVGVSGVLINLGFYIFITRKVGLEPTLAAPLAIELSIVSNFVLNNIWTFKIRSAIGSLRRKFVKFHLVAGVSGLVNYLVFLLLLRALGVNDILANLIGISVGTVFNYMLNSFWTWQRSEYGDESARQAGNIFQPSIIDRSDNE